MKLDKGKKNLIKKIGFMHTKKINAVFQNGINPVLGSIPRLPSDEIPVIIE